MAEVIMDVNLNPEEGKEKVEGKDVVEESKECIICLSESKEGQGKPTKPEEMKCECKVYFHSDCYQKHKESSNKCPMCREIIDPNNVDIHSEEYKIFARFVYFTVLQSIFSTSLIIAGFAKYEYGKYMLYSLPALLTSFFILSMYLLSATTLIGKCCTTGLENLRIDMIRFFTGVGGVAYCLCPVISIIFMKFHPELHLAPEILAGIIISYIPQCFVLWITLMSALWKCCLKPMVDTCYNRYCVL